MPRAGPGSEVWFEVGRAGQEGGGPDPLCVRQERATRGLVRREQPPAQLQQQCEIGRGGARKISHHGHHHPPRIKIRHSGPQRRVQTLARVRHRAEVARQRERIVSVLNHHDVVDFSCCPDRGQKVGGERHRQQSSFTRSESSLVFAASARLTGMTAVHWVGMLVFNRTGRLDTATRERQDGPA